MAGYSQNVYHVYLGERRTTVTLDNILSELLALKLGVTPDAPEAHATVRQWVQAELDANGDAGRIRVSQWLRERAIEAVIDRGLAKLHDAWILRNV